MTKTELRQEIKHRKAACSAEERATLSQRVVEQLLQSERWKAAHTVLLYHSLPDEVDTHELLLRAMADGKRVLLPAVVGDDLELRLFHAPETLNEGAFHIQEPTGAAFTDYEAIELAVVPGVAFTRDGRRLGRGRGYYDRLLPRLSAAYLTGLCWPFQLVEDLPTESFDIRLHAVISSF